MISRQELIDQKNQINKKNKRKRNLNKLSVSMLLFSSTFILDQVVSQNNNTKHNVIVEAKHSPSDFIGKITKYASDIASKNDLYASVMIAQAALESSWGNSTLTTDYNNLFGIKGSYNGKTTQMNTLEDDGSGNYYASKEGFRVYDNWGQSLDDYASVLTGDNIVGSWRYNYYKGARKSNTNSYTDATAWLTGRYATDTSYGSKLNSIINSYNLTQYDNVSSSSVNSGANTNVNKPTPEKSTSSEKGAYTVKSGDSVWSIASKFGMSLDQVRSLNNLSGDFLYPGQSLVVSGNSTTTTDSTRPTNNTTTPTTKNESTSGAYVVQAGDSVWKVANKYGMSMDQLVKMNNLSGYFIYPGQSLVVSGTSTNATESTKPTNNTTTPTTKNESSSGSYVVQAGDSVWKVANKYGMSMDQLVKMNNLSGYFIYPGQSLSVSSQSSSNTAVPTTVVSETNTPTGSQSSTNGSYTVQAGDSVWRVANKLGVSMDTLRQANNISGNFIYPGQVLTVSGNSAQQPAVAANNNNYNNVASQTSNVETSVSTSNVSNTTGSGSYTIQSNDSLYRIAVNHGMSLDELIQLNGFSGTNQLILPGQTISVK